LADSGIKAIHWAFMILNSASLSPNAFAVNRVLADPSVNPTAVVSNLEPLALNRLDQVQILKAVHFTKDDVPFPQILGLDWSNCAKLSRFDPAGHRIAARPELHRFPAAEFIDVECRPSHILTTVMRPLPLFE
jgi:hypothetical protein